MKKLMSISAVLAAAILLMGCGGGGGGSSDEPLTKAEYLQQGNAICKHVLEEGQAAVQELMAEHPGTSAPLTEPEKKQFVTQELFPPLRAGLDELGELSPPASDDKKINTLLSEYDATLKEVEKNPSSYYDGTAFEGPREKARAYGLSSCIF